MDPYKGEDSASCWLLQDFEVQDEIEIDQNPFEPNNLILIPQSTLHSDKSHHVALTAEALADGSSNEELQLPFLNESLNENCIPAGSTSTLSFSNVRLDGRGLYVPNVPTIFEGVECSEITSEIDGNVYSFLSSPQFQYPEPFQFSLEESVITSSVETADVTLNHYAGSAVDIPSKTKATSRHFVNSWRLLAEKAEKMRDRTGAVTNIKTIFKDEPFEINTDNTRGRNRTVSTSSGCSGKGLENQSTNEHEAEDDHCYAAVILKQRESSPSVRDHQYNQSSPRKQVKLISETECFTREPKLSFFKTRSYREKMLVKFMNSLFLKASKLESVSGTKIDTAVHYEEHIFTKENVQEASNVLKQRNSDGSRKFKRRLSASSDASEEDNGACQMTANLPKLQVDSEKKVTKPQVKVTVFKQPASETAPAGINVKFIWDKKNSQSPSHVIPAGFADFDLSKSNAVDKVSEDNVVCHVNSINNENERIFVDYDMGSKFSSEPEAIIETASDSDITDISSPPSVSVSCHGHHVEDSNHSTSVENHFEQHPSYTATQDAATITEPICGKCYLPRPPSTSTVSNEVYWIRCAQPLCHFLVHPDCVGFRVSSSAQLELLPPFRCMHHRN